MKIENTKNNIAFKRAYIDIQTLNKYGKGKEKIIRFLKNKNTPLKQYMQTTLNNKTTENAIGDVFISFKKEYMEGGYFDIAIFSFPKMQDKLYNKLCNFWPKDLLQDALITAEKETNYYCGFRDYDYKNSQYIVLGDGFQDGIGKLIKYLKSNKIVDDLNEHINRLKTKKL